ncbi:MAG: aldehyde ferredoxin oxidoreductase family protein [Candidatus Helarchaeota archaeon]|nr:aldehyde ferredoxin oxidoreductase family protein [Candidatus Helarchaeota archaeon]
MLGMHGKIARINLTDKKVSIEDLKEDIIKKYLGGLGIAMRYLYDEVPPEVQPLDPENKLIFMLGPLTSLIASTTRHVVVAKSPLSGILGESYSGGYWAYELRKAGLDGIIVEGKADKPVYLWIDNGQIEIKDASDFWELDAYETQIKIQEILGDKKIRVACIGQAGINLVKYACIINERDAAGRCGLGAVMGSKNLKAIAVRGNRDLKELMANQEEYKLLSQKAIKKISRNLLVTIGLAPAGTNGNFDILNITGDVPHRYWKVGKWKGDRRLKVSKWKKLIVEHESCYLCPVNCKKVCEVKDEEENVLYHGAGPEYETVSGFGTLLLNDDYPTILEANELCNRYGVDTISCSETIGFAMECWERGIITEKDTEGLILEWGNKDAILKLIEKISLRQGIGDILAEGVAQSAKKVGKNAEDFAVVVKGVEVPHHDPRAFHSMGLTYATGTHGANHCEGLTVTMSTLPRPDLGFPSPAPKDSSDPELSAKAVKAIQDVVAAKNSLIICYLVEDAIPYKTLLKLLKAIMGLDMTWEDFLTTGERIFNLKRMFNVRLGISKKDDVLPKRLVKEPLPNGGAADALPDVENMLPAYYKLRGWSADGIPTDETLKRLDLIVD